MKQKTKRIRKSISHKAPVILNEELNDLQREKEQIGIGEENLTPNFNRRKLDIDFEPKTSLMSYSSPSIISSPYNWSLKHKKLMSNLLEPQINSGPILGTSSKPDAAIPLRANEIKFKPGIG